MTDCLFFIPSGGGGAEKVSINIARILNKNGIKVHVVFIEGGSKNVCSYLGNNISSSFIESGGHLKRYFKIIKEINRRKPKVVFSSLTALSSVLIVSKIFFPKLKVIVRQCFTPKDGSKIINLTIRLLFRFADINIAQTEEMRKEMLETYNFPPDKVIAIYNPLDIEDIKRKVDGIIPIKQLYRFIALGRISPLKDYPTLLIAFSQVIKIIPQASLSIFGRPDNEQIIQEMKSKVEQLGLSENVVFHDYTDNPYKEMLQSNCFVLSSISEGLPNVMLEAMYLNLPCAATRCIPFISQAIQVGVNGYTAEVGDSDGLANAMLKAITLYGSVTNQNRNKEIEQQLIKIFN